MPKSVYVAAVFAGILLSGCCDRATAGVDAEESPRQVDVAELTPGNVIGLLGAPLGKSIVVEGTYVSRADLDRKMVDEHFLRVERVANVRTFSEPVLIAVDPCRFSDEHFGEAWKSGSRMRLLGYETGGFSGQTEGDILVDGMVAVPPFGFNSRFVALAELKPQTEPNRGPAAR